MEEIEKKKNIIETIRAMRKAREDLQRAIAADKHASRPLLTDIGLIGKIFNEYTKAIESRELTIDDRRMFIFIVQYLYAPHNLFGYKMPKGLRIAIARVLRIRSHNIVSEIGKATLLNYQVYTQFRQETNRIFERIIKWLEEEGHIKGNPVKETNAAHP